MALALMVLWSVLGLYLDFIKISEMANMPIRAMMRSMPAMSLRWPKIKRAVPLMLSTPIVAINRPMHAPMSPLKMLLLDTPAMTDRPKTARAKYSAGPKSRVTLAICGARNSRAKALISPPMVEANRAICRALKACPFTVIG